MRKCWLRSLRWRCILSVTLFTPIALVQAQVTSASCLDEYKWMFNVKGQSPCIVAAFLEGVCYTDGDWLISSLKPGEMYLPPTPIEADSCKCNTVTYSAVSACAVCQQRGYVSYHDWISSCPSGIVKNGSFPSITPDATSIPPWAFIDVSTSDNFDVKIAATLAGYTSYIPPNDYPGGSKGLSSGILIAIICGSVMGVAVCGFALYFRFRSRGRPTVHYVAQPKRVSTFFNRGYRQTTTYAPIAVDGPPKLPIFAYARKVASRPASANFAIDKDSTVESPTDIDDKSGIFKGFFSPTPSTPGNKSRRLSPPSAIEMPQRDSTRSFTFVSSIPSTDEGSGTNNGEAARRDSVNYSKSLNPYGSDGYPSHEAEQDPESPDDDTIYPWDSASNFTGGDEDSRRPLHTVEVPQTDPAALGPPSSQRSRLRPVHASSPMMLYPLGVRPSVYSDDSQH